MKELVTNTPPTAGKLEWDTFISHASEDKESFVRELARKLRDRGVKVWYDEFTLLLGDSLVKSIEKGLAKSRYGIVVLSHAFFSLAKDWPQKELAELSKRERDGEKVILPIWLDVSEEDILHYYPPLVDRVAAKAIDSIDTIVDKLLEVLNPEGTRKKFIPIGGSLLSLPCFFPSISSIKTELTPVEYLKVLQSYDYSHLLISAYDITNCSDKTRRKKEEVIRYEIEAILKASVINQKGVLIDCGTYESFWKGDDAWKRRDFQKCLKSLDFHFAFSFDKRETNVSQVKIGPDTSQRLVNNIEKNWLIDQRIASTGTILPVVHAQEEILPEVSYGVVERIKPVMIAIPERELGEGIIARAATLLKIRSFLNRTGHYYPIHLLGTGAPLSILLYVHCGADSFDGLDWCRETVNHDTATLYHFHEREFFGNQSDYCSIPSLPYNLATLAHNLLFYRQWMEKIQSAVSSGDMENLLQQYLPKEFLQVFNNSIQEILP